LPLKQHQQSGLNDGMELGGQCLGADRTVSVFAIRLLRQAKILIYRHESCGAHDQILTRRGFGWAPAFGLESNEKRWDNPTVIVTLDAKRRLTVPAVLAPAKPGDYFDAQFDAEEDALVFRRLAGKENWMTVLKACPVSPDDVPPRRRATARRRKL
jgi:hypothetical protein